MVIQTANEPISDVQWSNKNSTVFATVSADGRLEVFIDSEAFEHLHMWNCVETIRGDCKNREHVVTREICWALKSFLPVRKDPERNVSYYELLCPNVLPQLVTEMLAIADMGHGYLSYEAYSHPQGGKLEVVLSYFRGRGSCGSYWWKQWSCERATIGKLSLTKVF